MTGTKDPVAKQIKIYCVVICVCFLVAAGFLLFEIPYVRGAVCRVTSISDCNGMGIGYMLFFAGIALWSAYTLWHLRRLRSVHSATGLSRSRFAKATTWIRLTFVAVVLLSVAAAGFRQGVNADSIRGSYYVMLFLLGGVFVLVMGSGREHYLDILDEAEAKKHRS